MTGQDHLISISVDDDMLVHDTMQILYQLGIQLRLFTDSSQEKDIMISHLTDLISMYIAVSTSYHLMCFFIYSIFSNFRANSVEPIHIVKVYIVVSTNKMTAA